MCLDHNVGWPNLAIEPFDRGRYRKAPSSPRVAAAVRRPCTASSRFASPAVTIAFPLWMRDIIEIHRSVTFPFHLASRTRCGIRFAGPRLEVEDPAAAGVAATFETEAKVEDRRKLETSSSTGAGS